MGNTNGFRDGISHESSVSTKFSYTCTVLYCTVAMKVLPIFRAESGVYAWARIWGIIIGYKTIQLRPVRERSTVLGNVQI